MNYEPIVSTPTLLLALDLIGTAVFAISGAAAGVRNRLDIFGVSVLAIVAGSAGGLARDLLIGAVPPAAVSDWRYLTASLIAGLATFACYRSVVERLRIVLLFDAAGLALFAVSGTQKALSFGINPLAAVVLGVLTGIGGGMMRDLLVREIPVVLRAELYAVAALAGAGVVVAGHVLDWPALPTTIAGALVCFSMRFLAMRRRWNLPVAPHAV